MAGWLRRKIRRALSSAAWRRTSRWVRGIPDYSETTLNHTGEGIDAEVAVYFGDTRKKLYQLNQWLPILETLDKTHSVAIVVRRPSVVADIEEHTHLPVIVHRRFLAFMDFIHTSPFQLALYVNNGMTNFQLLGYSPMVHVHINHGESDKLSMVSNQAKAYDKTFVAGQAAIDRHKRALLDFDLEKLIPIGRPQLDVERENTIPDSSQTTIMYAPTWEGENDANNYTSVDRYGANIVRAILALENTRLIYKPHPRIEASNDELIAHGDQEIRSLIEQANLEGGEHLIQMQGDILGMLDTVDLLITDISSVGLDFLYLQPDKPIMITDRRSDSEALVRDSPIAGAATLIDENSIGDLVTVIKDVLNDDKESTNRTIMRQYYFGDRAVGDSTNTFVAEVGRLLSSRKKKLETFDRHQSDGAMEAGQ